jgi:hypothetical protein
MNFFSYFVFILQHSSFIQMFDTLIWFQESVHWAVIERFGVKLNIKTNATFEHAKFVVNEVIN